MQPKRAQAWEQGYNSYACTNHACNHIKCTCLGAMIMSCKPITTKLKKYMGLQFRSLHMP